MKGLIVASHNAGKITEVRAVLGAYFDEIISGADFPHIPEPEETEPDLAGNAHLKAQAYAGLGYWVLADDSGMAVMNLPQWNAVLTKRQTKALGGYDAATQHILKELGSKDPAVQFQCCLVLLKPDGTEHVVLGVNDGKLVYPGRKTRDDNFGFDPYFFSPDFNKTFGELSIDQKNTISHRGRALQQLLSFVE